MAESSSSSFDSTLANMGKCDGFYNFREWEPKIRLAIGLHKPKLLPILDGKRRPTGAANAEAAAEWTEHNNQLFSILFFMTSESANVTAKTYMSKDVGGMGEELLRGKPSRGGSMATPNKQDALLGRNSSKAPRRKTTTRRTSSQTPTAFVTASRKWGRRYLMKCTSLCFSTPFQKSSSSSGSDTTRTTLSE